MRLKSIKLAGFKSFVDPTSIEFPSNLCTVVGPNGCGKSNVIDAVRWVMGESSAKNLRGESMTDVIFNGSGGRKPVGQASVELIFDNDDHKLAGEFANFSEVSIKRKVDRDAQSTYSLNGTKVRRKDITDVFLGTGLGARSYSIIEQGMVSNLIESKPEELRVFIEEAAGISKYKERRRETESRIKRTKDNLNRLADIREELGRQLSHLQRQSIAAEKYEDLKKNERSLKANLDALNWAELDTEIKGIQRLVGDDEVIIDASVASQLEVDAEIENRLVQSSALSDLLEEVQARFYDLGNNVARVEQSIEHHKEKTQKIEEDLFESKNSFERIQKELNVDLRRITALEQRLIEVAPSLEMARATEKASSESLQKAEVVLQDWQDHWEKFNTEAEAPRQVSEVEQARILQLEKIVQRGIERKNRLQEEIEKLKSGNDRETPFKPDSEIDILDDSIDLMHKESRALGGQISQFRIDLEINDDAVDKVRNTLQKARGECASLEALQRASTGRDRENVNAWLNKKGLGEASRAVESLKIEAGWEYAVEVVLGKSLQAVVVDNLDEFFALVGDFPKGAAEFVQGKNQRKSVSTRVDNRKTMASVVDGDFANWESLSNIYLAETLEEASALRSTLGNLESVITKRGVWMGAEWLKLDDQSQKETVVGRRERIALLSSEIQKEESKLRNLLEDQNQFGKLISDTENKRENLQIEIAIKTKESGRLRSEFSARKAKLEEAESRLVDAQSELVELEKQIEVEQRNITSSRSKLQFALDGMEVNVAERDELELKRVDLQNKLQLAKEESRTDKEKVHSFELDKQAVHAQLKTTRSAMDRMASQVQRSGEKISILENQLHEADEPLIKMGSDLERFLEQRLEVEKELAEAKAKLDANEFDLRSLEKKRNEIQVRVTELRESLTEKKLKGEGATVKREAFLERLVDAGLNIQDILENMPEGKTIEALEEELEKLEGKIHRLGPINLAAIDEFTQRSERKLYLDQQNEDLERALATLQNAIKKIDKETRTRFKDTFEVVNKGLQTLFPKVFGGGHAYLEMTGEDLLDTGVAIMARPPGKRNSTIHLLSGGEKALTAIALVFSIFQLNPSPFCMLDEVDAPLDDANVGRYANLVKEMSKSVQFIFITHNKITMEMANQLLGVTMHEPGVSRIVTVDIEEAAKLAAM